MKGPRLFVVPLVVLVLLLAGASVAVGSSGATVIVNSTADTNSRDGVLTLREAMVLVTGGLAVSTLDSGECAQISNSTYAPPCSTTDTIGAASGDTIVFNNTVFPLDVDPPATITLGSSLPTLSTGNDTVSGAGAGVIIDGVTQTFTCFVISGESSDNNSIKGLQVKGCDIGVLIRTGADDNTIGGTMAGDRNVISGNLDGVHITSTEASGNRVSGNYIGVNASGTASLPNIGDGVVLDGAGASVVGGMTAGAGNVISGNFRGVVILGLTSGGHLVQDNKIGTDPSGAIALGNTHGGVLIVEAPNNTIGGPTAAARNLISGNTGDAVKIFGSNGNTVQGNFIGTDASGTLDLHNNGNGVSLYNGASNNTIGGPASGAGNVIAFNGNGAFVESGTGNAIRGNSIFSNGLLGIDLGASGVTLNDAGDADTGANNLQNFPVLTGANGIGGNTTIVGTLNSTTSTTFALDFYSSPACDTSGYGEGKTFIGASSVTTDGSGNASISATFPGLVPVGSQITATATDPSGNTSEFSQCQPFDTDGDTVPDTTDNCPTAPNKDQLNLDSLLAAAGASVMGDASGDACDTDNDNDGLLDSREVFVGTDPLNNCSATPVANDEAVDASPTDNNDDQRTTLADVLRYIPVFNSSGPGPPYNPRFDLNASGTITLADVLTFIPYFNKTCTPPSSPVAAASYGEPTFNVTPEPEVNPAGGSDDSPHGDSGITQVATTCQCTASGTDEQDTGHPVYLHNGEFFDHAVDLVIPGRGFDWKFERKYRSGITFDGPLGHNWEFNYDRRLVVRSNGDVVRMDGYTRADTYVHQGDGSYSAPTGFYTRLVKNGDNTYTERDHAGNVVQYSAADSSGIARMTSLSDRNGNTMQFFFDGLGRLSYLLDTLGRRIDYRYNPEGRLTEVTDFTGRSIRMLYDGNLDLVRVASPAITGTPNGNDFPDGKTTRYAYSSDSLDAKLNHNLLTITAPNEVPSLGSARVSVAYDTSDRVTSQTLGGTNVTGVPAGGTIAYSYGGSLGCPLPAQTCVIDRNGNRTEYRFNTLGNITSVEEFTNRDVRPTDPTSYVTTHAYNSDGELQTSNLPDGNTRQETYDSANPDRLLQGNRLSEQSTADIARGGDQATIKTTYTYEPIYNQVRTVVEPRGNDPAYVPQNGGAQSAARYTTTNTYDYEESCNFTAIGVKVGRPAAQVQSLLTAAGICSAPLGDVNGDGVTNQVNGNVIRVQRPSVNLLPGSNQAGVEGSTIQPIVELYTYNQFGQKLNIKDAEGNVDTSEYYPERDPNGDGVIDNPAGDPTTGGYLKQTARDTASGASRDSGTNPTPVNVRHRYQYDTVGNVTREVDGRGIATDYAVNQLNQVVQIKRSVAHDIYPPDPTEPITLTDFQYLERTFYDFNNNVVVRQAEDRGNTSGVDGNPPSSDLPSLAKNPDPPGGGAFVDRVYKYDILDQQLEMLEEAANGASPEFLRTRYRYDHNGNQVLVIQPEGNATSSVYDERDLPFQNTRGALAPPPANCPSPNPCALLAASDPVSYDTRGGLPSTATNHYDLNRNLVETVDAEDTDGSAANNSDLGGPGDRTRYIYDGFDRRTSTVDSLGNQTVFQYDPAGNVMRVTRYGPVGGASPTADGPDTLLWPVSSAGSTQPANLVSSNLLEATETRYDELSRAYETDRGLFVNTIATVRTPDVDDGATSLGKGNLTPGDTCAVPGIVGPSYLGCVSTRTEYDRNSRATFAVQDDTDTSRAFYDGTGRVIKTLDPEGNTVETAYDDNSNVIETRETDVSQVGGVPSEIFLTTNFYDPLDRLQHNVDNLGQTQDYRYDSRGNLACASDAKGPAGPAITRRAFSGGALTVNTTNQFGNVAQHFYDGLSRKVREERVLTASGQGDGVNVGCTLEGVKTTTPTPDLTQGGADGIIRTGSNWDKNSLQSSLLDDQGNVTVYLYDNLDRRITETKGLTVNTMPLNKAKILGPRNVVTPTMATINSPAVIASAKIDSQLAAAKVRLNAVAGLFPALADSVDDHPPTTIAYGYDADGNVLILEDENDSETFSKYDALNRRIAVRVFRSGQADSHAGDPLFAPTPASDPSNPSTSFPAVLGTTKQDYQYDGLSRLVRATDNNAPGTAADDSVVTDAYDSLSRTIEETQKIGALPAKAVSSAWRAEDLRGDVIYPQSGAFSRELDYTYDALDRLNTVKDNGAAQPIPDYDYIGAGRVLQRSYPQNSTRMTYLENAGISDVGYDGIRRPLQLRHLRADNSLVAGFADAYDRANDKLSETKLHNPANNEVYAYDSADRLTDFDRPGGGAIAPLHSDWKLDGAGNWKQVLSTESGAPTTETRQHSSFNEITSRNPGSALTVLSDDNGNETDDGKLLLRWDFMNRLRTVTRKSDSALLAVYSYDAVGRRIRKVVTSSGALNGTTDFYLDGWQEVEERNGSDALVQQYVYGVYIDEPLVLDRNLGGGDSAIGPGDQRLFYHQNTLYSTFALTDAAGVIKEGYQYDAYGRQTVFAPGGNGVVDFGGDDAVTSGGVSALANPYLFTGRRFDGESGLYYYRNRYLNAEQGRFVTRDLLGPGEAGLNLYEYSGSSPQNLTDPGGSQEEKPRCCCCCVDSIKMANVKTAEWLKPDPNDKTINYQMYGHEFDVVIQLSYQKEAKADADCTLIWAEKPTSGYPGVPKDRWTNIYKVAHDNGAVTETFTPWDARKRTCGSEESVTLHDRPGSFGVRNDSRSRTRVLDFAITVESGKGCDKCSSKSLTVFATQVLKQGKAEFLTYKWTWIMTPLGLLPTLGKEVRAK